MVTADRRTVASNAQAAPATAFEPPSRDHHHNPTMITANNDHPTIRAAGTTPNSCPTPVGSDNQCVSSELPPSAFNQPRSTPAANVQAANTPTTSAAPTPTAFPNPTRAAQIHTRNGSATAAVTLTATANATTTMPAACLRSRTSSVPAANSEIMIRSLCAPPTRCT